VRLPPARDSQSAGIRHRQMFDSDRGVDGTEKGESVVKVRAITLVNISVACVWVGALEFSATRAVTVHAAAEGTAGAVTAGEQVQPKAGYVGDETCTTCHTGYDRSVAASKHGFKAHELTPAARQGCESCHGPGEAHASDPGNVKPFQFASVSATAANDQCQTCHNRGEHALWSGSQHENRSVKCIDCHSVHTAAGPALLRDKTQQITCARCHQTITNKQQRFSHMPVREGKMQCSSCHNVHGSVNVKLLRVGATVDQSCSSCHTEKRGPFLWEHAPVVDSCTTCHDSHGSNNDSMLVAKQPFLCQRCHVTSRHPPTMYDGYVLNNAATANKMFAKGCANCHQQVHGSNHPNGKFFLR
jgi:DmsE family decaheme c-type cytochrome